MIRLLARVSRVAGAIGLTTAIAHAQEVVIRGDPKCQNCRIDRQHIVRIGETGDVLIKGPVVVPVARDSRGRYFVNDQDDGPLKVFGPDGRFLQMLGGSGEGPGEMMRPSTHAIDAEDSVFVLDPRLMRASVFGPDLNFVRAFNLPMSTVGIHSRVVRGHLVVNGIRMLPPGIGFPIHILDLSGRHLKRVGPEERLSDDSQSELVERVIGLATRGDLELLVAHRLRYRWWRLSPAFDVEAEFVRDAKWFRQYNPPNTQEAQMDGVSYLKSIWEDATGRTWIALGVIHVHPTGDGKTRRTESSRIEVLDVNTATVIASSTIPERFVSAFSDGTVVFSESRDDGRTVLSVTRLTLRNPN